MVELTTKEKAAWERKLRGIKKGALKRIATRIKQEKRERKAETATTKKLRKVSKKLAKRKLKFKKALGGRMKRIKFSKPRRRFVSREPREKITYQSIIPSDNNKGNNRGNAFFR